MLDSDLAELYGVETKALNQAVKRNSGRFPLDFMFACETDELIDLRSQFVTANRLSDWNFMRRRKPVVFTERAIQMNISIMRVFVKHRSFLLIGISQDEKLDKLEKNTNKLFKIVFERMDSISEIVEIKFPARRKKIGLKPEPEK